MQALFVAVPGRAIGYSRIEAAILPPHQVAARCITHMPHPMDGPHGKLMSGYEWISSDHTPRPHLRRH